MISVLRITSRRQWVALWIAIVLAVLIVRLTRADELIYQPMCDEEYWREMCGSMWWWCREAFGYCAA